MPALRQSSKQAKKLRARAARRRIKLLPAFRRKVGTPAKISGKTSPISSKLQKKVVVPVIDKDSNEIIPAEYPGFDRLKKGAYGIMEPTSIKEFPKEKINLVIVPGIAFDENGNRVGFGKGYFDRFLAKLPDGTPAIALAFDLQIVKHIPVAEHDKKMKKIITEKREIEGK